MLGWREFSLSTIANANDWQTRDWYRSLEFHFSCEIPHPSLSFFASDNRVYKYWIYYLNKRGV